MAQSHGGGGGGFHGGGGGFHGGGGGWHGGGWGGGGWHGGGWGGGGWPGGWGGWHGGWGWGGYYGGWYPGFGFGFDAYDPFYYGYGYGYPPYAYAPPAVYAQPPVEYAPDQYAEMTPGAAAQPPGHGIYTWNLGIQGGHCDRATVERALTAETGHVSARAAGSAILGGIVVSPVVGGKIGPRFDLADQACATAALELAPIGTTVSWTTASGVPVSIRPTRTTNLSDGSSCRDFTATARFASGKEMASGSACRNNTTGGWQMSGQG
jgi:surface antigen